MKKQPHSCSRAFSIAACRAAKWVCHIFFFLLWGFQELLCNFRFYLLRIKSYLARASNFSVTHTSCNVLTSAGPWPVIHIDSLLFPHWLTWVVFFYQLCHAHKCILLALPSRHTDCCSCNSLSCCCFCFPCLWGIVCFIFVWPTRTFAGGNSDSVQP